MRKLIIIIMAILAAAAISAGAVYMGDYNSQQAQSGMNVTQGMQEQAFENENMTSGLFGMKVGTSYGIASNDVYITFSDLLGKAQYISNITFSFADTNRTRAVAIADFLLNQSYQEDVYGMVNISQGKGKYKTYERNCSISGNNSTETCVDNYYDGLGNLMECSYILADKSCLKEAYNVTGQTIRYDYLPTPNTKEKIITDGLKIEQKVIGSVPLAKGGVASIKITMPHPLFYGFTVPYWENKYNITACSEYGCVELDPAWWNTTWGAKMAINISVSSGITQQNYTVPINVTWNSKMNADFSDLRFTNSSENKEDNYWIQDYKANSWAYVWVKIDKNITTTNQPMAYMYYNNTAVATTSNISTTFLFGDDFNRADGGVGNGWKQNQTNVGPNLCAGQLISANQVSLSDNTTVGTGSFCWMNHSFANQSTSVAVGFLVNVKVSNIDAWFWSDNGTTSYTAVGGFYIYAKSSVSQFKYYSLAFGDAVLRTMSTNTVYKFDIRYNYTRMNVTINGTVNNSLDYQGPPTYPKCQSLNDIAFGTNEVAGATIDDVYVRYYQMPEPTYTIGSEQTYTAGTCTYTSGNWLINCNDNCTENSAITVAGNLTIYSTGAGNVIFTNITANNYLYNATHPCNYYWNNRWYA